VHGHVHTAIRQGRGDLAEIADDDPLDFLFSRTSGAEGQLSEDVVDAAFAGDRDAAAAHVLERLDLVDHPGAADEVEVRSTGNVSYLIGDYANRHTAVHSVEERRCHDAARHLNIPRRH